MWVIYVFNRSLNIWEGMDHTRDYKEADAIVTRLMGNGCLVNVKYYEW